ncbi:MAG: type I-C CRISPR-associated protein Cas8c/Csd1 [Pseudomonadota bacterium]
MILTALNDHYARLSQPDAYGETAVPAFGYSLQQVGLCLSLSPDGELLSAEPLTQTTTDAKGKETVRDRLLAVPTPPKRSANVAPGFLFDKTAYVLGREINQRDRTLEAHEAFKSLHAEALEASNDEGLVAFRLFLDRWSPDDWDSRDDLTDVLLDKNIVFRLGTEHGFIHDRPAAKALRTAMLEEAAASPATCLVTGDTRPVARLHPAVKGVNGAQSSGASLSSFNLDAFSSYGREQGDNAPVGERVAAAYTTVLNHLLRRGEDNFQRHQIGDATMVFWADDPEAEIQTAGMIGGYEEGNRDDVENLAGSLADQLAQGLPVEAIDDKLKKAKLYVLGLSPNAARLSVRFWETPSFGQLIERFKQHADDLRIEPPASKNKPPAVWQLAYETGAYMGEAGQEKINTKTVSSRIAGDLMRALLTGGRYPRTLLTNIVMRLRIDRHVTARRVAMVRACLVREARMDGKPEEEWLPMAWNENYKGRGMVGYHLGRLFAEIEYTQALASDFKLNATVKDKYYGAASTVPARIFPSLMRGLNHHLSKLRKTKKGSAMYADDRIQRILSVAEPEWPIRLSFADQGAFAVGYYHQKDHTEREIKERAKARTNENKETDDQ